MHVGATNPIIVIGVTLFAVLLFNGILILRVRNQKRDSTTKAWSDVLEIAKSPFKKSDADYDELAQLVRKPEENQEQDSQ